MDDANVYLQHHIPSSQLGKLKRVGVIFEEEGAEGDIEPGAEFSKTKNGGLQKEPEISFEKAEGKTYAVLMIDPDAPDREGDGSTAAKFGPWLHYLLTDVTTKHPKGHVQVPYMGPAPPMGKHRYIFLLYEQHGHVVVESKERKKWDFGKFTADNAGILTPLASNFFYCDSR